MATRVARGGALASKPRDRYSRLDDDLFDDLRRYGVQGDGSTDDTVALQAWIDAQALDVVPVSGVAVTPNLASTAFHSTRLLLPKPPSGKWYKTSAPLTLNYQGVTLEGAAPGVFIYNVTSGSDVIRVNYSGTALRANVTIQNLSLVGTGTTSVAVSANLTKGLTLRNLSCRSHPGQGVLLRSIARKILYDANSASTVELYGLASSSLQVQVTAGSVFGYKIIIKTGGVTQFTTADLATPNDALTAFAAYSAITDVVVTADDGNDTSLAPAVLALVAFGTAAFAGCGWTRIEGCHFTPAGNVTIIQDFGGETTQIINSHFEQANIGYYGENTRGVRIEDCHFENNSQGTNRAAIQLRNTTYGMQKRVVEIAGGYWESNGEYSIDADRFHICFVNSIGRIAGKTQATDGVVIDALKLDGGGEVNGLSGGSVQIICNYGRVEVQNSTGVWGDLALAGSLGGCEVRGINAGPKNDRQVNQAANGIYRAAASLTATGQYPPTCTWDNSGSNGLYGPKYAAKIVFPANKAFLTLTDRKTPTAASTLRLFDRNVGATSVYIEVLDGAAANTFKIKVYNVASGGSALETLGDYSNPAAAAADITANSAYLTCTDLLSATGAPSNNPRVRSRTKLLDSGGTFTNANLCAAGAGTGTRLSSAADGDLYSALVVFKASRADEVLYVRQKAGIDGQILQTKTSGNWQFGILSSACSFSTSPTNNFVYTHPNKALATDLTVYFAGVAAAINAGPESLGIIDTDGSALVNHEHAFEAARVGSTGSTLKYHWTATAALDFPLIAAAGQQELTVTVTGAAVGDLAFAAPSTTLEAGLEWTAYVSAANTVTVRVGNRTAAGIDPASRTWRVGVLQY